MAVKPSELDARTLQSLSDDEASLVRRLIAAYGPDYDSVTDVIADAREMLR